MQNVADAHEVRHRQSPPALHASLLQPIVDLTMSRAGGHEHQIVGFRPGCKRERCIFERVATSEKTDMPLVEQAAL